MDPLAESLLGQNSTLMSEIAAEIGTVRALRSQKERVARIDVSDAPGAEAVAAQVAAQMAALRAELAQGLAALPDPAAGEDPDDPLMAASTSELEKTLEAKNEKLASVEHELGRCRKELERLKGAKDRLESRVGARRRSPAPAPAPAPDVGLPSSVEEQMAQMQRQMDEQMQSLMSGAPISPGPVSPGPVSPGPGGGMPSPNNYEDGGGYGQEYYGQQPPQAPQAPQAPQQQQYQQQYQQQPQYHQHQQQQRRPAPHQQQSYGQPQYGYGQQQQQQQYYGAPGNGGGYVPPPDDDGEMF